MTHPFHPLRGREFELIDYRCAWGEDRVYFYDDQGRLARLPAAWTDVVEPSPFVVMAAGRSDFRLEDLIRLAEWVGSWRASAMSKRRPKRRSGGVKEKTP